MTHRIYNVVALKVVKPYTLELEFDDRIKKVINFETVLHGEMYSPLREESFFNRVVIDPEVHTIVWPNGADFDPAILHDWEDYVDEIARRAKGWELVEK